MHLRALHAASLTLAFTSQGCFMRAVQAGGEPPPIVKLAKLARARAMSGHAGDGPLAKLGKLEGGPNASHDVATDAGPDVARADKPHAPRRHERTNSHEPQFYRFDFVLGTTREGGASVNEAFTLVSEEGHSSEAKFSASATALPARALPTPKAVTTTTQAETKVTARFIVRGEHAILEFTLDASSSAPATARQINLKGRTLVVPGKPVVVAGLEQEHTRYELTLTATKLP